MSAPFAFSRLSLRSRLRAGSLAVGLAVAAVLLPGCLMVVRPPGPEPVFATAEARASHNLRVYDRAVALVGERFYAPDYGGIDWPAAVAAHRPAAAAATDTAALYAEINALLDQLGDAHTHALTPREAWEDETRERARVGLQLEQVDEQWLVDEVVPDSPAAAAGVQPGWIVQARAGVPFDNRTDVRTRLGEVVRWRFVDAAGHVRELELAGVLLRDDGGLAARVLPGGWVYLRFDEFEPWSRRWLHDELRAHRDAPGVVIDLRRNYGGSTWDLARTLGDFFDRRVDYGAFIARDGNRDQEDSAGWRPVRYAGRVAVLTAGGSASSAEIFAATLQQTGRAQVIGRPTAGVVIGSRMYRLPDGGRLQVGLFDFVLPDGTRLEGRGVQPDIEVARTAADLRVGRDADVEAAVSWLAGGAAPEGGRAVVAREAAAGAAGR